MPCSVCKESSWCYASVYWHWILRVNTKQCRWLAMSSRGLFHLFERTQDSVCTLHRNGLHNNLWDDLLRHKTCHSLQLQSGLVPNTRWMFQITGFNLQRTPMLHLRAWSPPRLALSIAADRQTSHRASIPSRKKQPALPYVMYRSRAIFLVSELS
jgi:hypothetical protein